MGLYAAFRQTRVTGALRSLMLTVAVFCVAGASLAFTASSPAPPDHEFTYTITATGTEDVSGYPDLQFAWTVKTNATETWFPDPVYVGSKLVDISGLCEPYTGYLYPSPGPTWIIKEWLRPLVSGSNGGRDVGTDIDETNNRLVIRAYTGGTVDEDGECTAPGSYKALYYIYGSKPVVSTWDHYDYGEGTVNATEGTKEVGQFDAVPPPQHEGTVTVNSRTVSDDDERVTTSISVDGPAGTVWASTGHTETETRLWAATESGQATVNALEGDKYIATSTLAALNGDTSWSVSHDNGDVETWMVTNEVWARALNGPPDCSAATPSVALIWPPNGKFVPVVVEGVTDPEGDALVLAITAIHQDEPVDPEGDGRGVGTATAEVRADRDGFGNGRVYHIGFAADDGRGGTCSGEVLVAVPQRKGQDPVDDGALYDSTTPP